MRTRLSNSALAALPEGISAPGYDRSALGPGILHVGMGNFHRAHQAVYADDLLRAGGDPAWGILGAGVMPADEAMREGLAAQDHLYSVTEMGPQGDDVRVIGAMAGFLPVTPGHGPMIAAMADPAVRIVSLTVTEGGYFVSAQTGGFNAGHPSIRADIAEPERPTTVFGAIVAGLRARRAAGLAPFTVMCCDNLPHNGAVTRAAVCGVARGQDPGLADWIEAEVAFPNGMVDRITPATTEPRRAGLAAGHGLDDARPVFCEPFRQWVLEDNFPAGRPALETVGVQFVEDVTPYEHMKIRMLNGGHAMIAYPAGLLGLEFAHDAMADAQVAGFFEKVERTEVFDVVEAVPGATPEQYLASLKDRFGNPRIEDTIRRLCLDGSNRQPKFIVPSIEDNLAAGRPVPGLALESALWARYCLGVDEAGGAIAPNDPDWERLTEQAGRAKRDPLAWLELRDVYGGVADHPGFRESFARALDALYARGVRAVLAEYLG
ncbi:mannitol dehydrogenase family protein [uncultured Albimonas sp.]|uniref:mannitol dehydrogenase family protein n=1 Tax=uncultured Albimonas sp. TaxID=1331701 RepID=UPI0030EC3FDD